MFDLAGKCLVIGEVAQAHDGSLGTAHAFIDLIADSGADAVKFQTHIASAESTLEEPWRVKFSLQDETRYEYWRRMEFTEPQWHGLKKHADNRGLFFLSSPFSLESVELLTRVGVAAWKIASGEVTNTPMFEKMAETRLPFLISTGMSSLDELNKQMSLIRLKDLPFAVLQCTSMYPTPPEKVGMNLIPIFKALYQCPVGISDHSGTIYPSLAAVSLGASVVEVHVTLHKKAFGPDVPASVSVEEFGKLIEGVRFIEKMNLNPVDKNEMAIELKEMRRLFTKSVAVTSDLPVGTVLRIEHLTLKKPGTGIPASRLSSLYGRQLRKPVLKGNILIEEDLVP